jgi:hypothetical protein
VEVLLFDGAAVGVTIVSCSYVGMVISVVLDELILDAGFQ